MIPLKDNIPAQRLSIVNTALIGLNVAVFLYEISQGSHLCRLFIYYSLLPVRYSNRGIAQHFSLFEQAIPFVSYMFLHGGWLHLIGNMWTLWIFGDNVEDHLGHCRYLVFYLLVGIAAGLFHVITGPHSRLPTVGASGAVAGVMGAYFVLYPRARVLTLVPLLLFFPLVEIPAFFFLGLWFVMQFYNGVFGLLSQAHSVGGIAWWAHVGGFIAGILLLGLLGRARTARVR